MRYIPLTITIALTLAVIGMQLRFLWTGADAGYLIVFSILIAIGVAATTLQVLMLSRDPRR